jgi:hypothetical protein
MTTDKKCCELSSVSRINAVNLVLFSKSGCCPGNTLTILVGEMERECEWILVAIC